MFDLDQFVAIVASRLLQIRRTSLYVKLSREQYQIQPRF